MVRAVYCLDLALNASLLGVVSVHNFERTVGPLLGGYSRQELLGAVLLHSSSVRAFTCC